MKKMMKRGFALILISAVFITLLISNASAIFIGLTDGYVRDNAGTPLSGALVVATVSGCSGGYANGCVGNDTTEANGYYIIDNLNLPKYGSVSVTATKSGGTGTASGTADGYQIAHVNVTVCYAPSSPTLTDVPNGDSPDVGFSWTSGNDPLLQTTYDDFILDLIVTSPATSPQNRTGLSFTMHNWGARTCNNMCCSAWAYDSFTLTCPAPSAPSLTDVPNSHNTTVTFSWNSGIDPHGRTIHDVFDLDGGVIDPAVSPITRAGLSFALHTWKVKTCNIYCCSGWTSDTFTTGNSAPSVPTNTNFTAYNETGVTSLRWDSGIDPDGDATYDEFRFENGSIITPAVSPINVTSEELIEWSVRTCDSYGLCSSWVDVDSVTCARVAEYCPACPVCEVCEPCEERGGGGVIYKYRKTELYCNGIRIREDILLKINLMMDGKQNKISIYGQNWSLEDLKYCPWCYNGIKDYDEIGVDCGGSCRECKAIELPFRWEGISPTTLFIIVIIAAIIYVLHRFGVFKKMIESIKKYFNRG